MRPLAEGIPLYELVQLIGARLERGDSQTLIYRLATLSTAQAGDASFLASSRYRAACHETHASVVIVRPDDVSHVPLHSAVVSCSDPYLAYGRLARHVQKLAGTTHPRATGIHPSACIESGVELGDSVSIGPNAVIGRSSRIGAGCRIGAGVVIGELCRIGEASVIHGNVTIEDECELGRDCIVHSGTVIGSDGFGFAAGPQGWEKIPQLGRVLIGNAVEIGSNCSIDRGALEDTIIEDGCKLDNLIQIAHNVRVGAGTAIAACVGIAGSAVIGKGCMIGGSAGILGHLSICDRVTISPMSLVTASIDQPGFYTGIFPLMSNADWERAAVLLRRLPDLRARVRRLESDRSNRPQESS
ncbi:MAG: UDP-3-O-(3-hydroxymyristoyl)glucosamine N-acyltransferase [Pseudomonadota bacterium]|jgi:UDP-3-O-[3-hydroxymyristoyl] glucosamine N-acyltransferase